MANIKVTIDYPIANGLPVTFKSPADCSQVTGLVVCYPEGDGYTSKDFQFADAHGNNVGDIDHLFASNVLVKVILDVDASKAYVQNADTNAYLEGRFDKKADLVNGKVPSNQLPEMNYAPTSHNHSASEITSGTLAVARGGTGNTSVDTTPTSGSTKMVTSGGVYTALAGKAASSHNHAASEITSGTLAVARGGTGVTANPSMLTNLATTTAASVFAASPRPGVTGTLPVANGGTGKASWTANRLVYPSAATTMNQLAFPSVAGSVLRQGTSGAPYWTSIADLKTALGMSDWEQIATYSGKLSYKGSATLIAAGALNLDTYSELKIVYSGNMSFDNAESGAGTYDSSIYLKLAGFGYSNHTLRELKNISTWATSTATFSGTILFQSPVTNQSSVVQNGSTTSGNVAVYACNTSHSTSGSGYISIAFTSASAHTNKEALVLSYTFDPNKYSAGCNVVASGTFCNLTATVYGKKG